MTESTRHIFDVFEVRKTGQQKAAFRAWAAGLAQAQGYPVREEKASFGARNLIIGDPDSAAVLFTAHYDTCAWMPVPNFITPKCLPIYLAYQILLALVILGLGGGVSALAGRLLGPWAVGPAYYLAVLGIFGLLIAGPANPHTANDNTSGVTAVLDLMQAMPADLRGKVAFVLFDLEEAGLFGSSGFASAHKKTLKKTPVINFDCVSDGDTLLFALNKKAKHLADSLTRAYPPRGGKAVDICAKRVFYPSDQANFACGVGVAALKTGRWGILYMDRIHTRKDTVYQAENIDFLTQGSVALARILAGGTNEI